MDSGQAVVKENQVLDPVPGLQLHLLGGGVQYMAVPAGVPFLGPVGPRLAVSEQNLTELVRLEAVSYTHLMKAEKMRQARTITAPSMHTPI